MSRRRPLALLAAATITLAACGSEATSTPVAEQADSPAATDAPATTEAPAVDEPAATDAPVAATTPAPTEAPAVDEPAPEPTEAPAEEPVDEPAAEEPAPEPTEPPAPEPVGIVDGCSADGSPTLAESAAGPAPEIEIRPESADGPLIDLAVRRINCAGGWANLRNEIPSDRPLLIWFWAPH